MKYLDELTKLNLSKDKFAIFGSGSLAIRGLRENKDLDIVVKQDLWKKLIKSYPVSEGKIHIDNIEIFKDWKPYFDNLDILIDDAEIIEGFRFVKLKYVIEWKKKMNREKDKVDIKLIEDYLNKNR